MKREKDFKRNFKNSGKIKRIFCTRNVFNPREQKQKTKESFSHISRQKNILVFGYIKKEKKRETELKRRIKKRRVIKTRNHYSRHRKKTKHGKTCKKKAQEKRKQRKRSFFEVKWRKIVLQKFKKIFSTKSLTWRNIEIIKRPKKKEV